MEAHYYDPKMNKWYALINSGIFRKETLEPLGLGDKTIHAWGIGASRVATLLSGKDSMRDITGATCDFNG
jgi:phenylalanyl-tRNA synthetase alpha subunit